MLNAFKQMSNCDPEGARLADQECRRLAFEASGAKDEEQFKTAIDVVYWDGMYGPILPGDFEEEFGDRLESFKQALEIVRNAIDASFPDYEYSDPEFDSDVCGVCDACKINIMRREERMGDIEDPCENPLPNCKIEGRTIRDEMFNWYKRIYGGF